MTTETKSCPLCGTDAPLDADQCHCGYTFASAKGGSDPVDWSPEMSAATSSLGDSWRMSGWTFALVGVVALVLSLFMGTTVDTGGPYGGGEVVNLDLQFHKGLAIGGSLFAIGLGVFCLAVGSILDAISRKG
ncbi:MAG: hypothetical protein JNN10_16145 [Sphingopyxis sp.]|uniref:hypothetical protein n=1 Tax=Sphingopyxis sp. TaxID=1908224 RepID=UPI001A43E1EF|nr:hypothetical protein [Sphingopyxis sp.]MBL9067813.1 hypothetical protein [Sphingopyxis sp.]